MPATIDYYFIPNSPWSYLGHERLLDIAQRHGARVVPKPFDLAGTVFPASGGLPLPQRPRQRQAYRLVELPRWAAFRDVELNVQPAHFPVDSTDANRIIVMAQQAAGGAGDAAALDLGWRLMRAVWVQQRDIADPATLVGIADEAGFDGAVLYRDRAQADDALRANTDEALARGVFGAPWYHVDGEPFWGQDRLEFVERALAARG